MKPPPKKTESNWGDINDLEEIIDSSPFLKRQDGDILTALAGSEWYASFKLLVAANGNVGYLRG